MRAVIQRVAAARVTVQDEVIGSIGRGLVAFVGAGQDDGDKDLDYLASKILGLRIFADDAGKMNRSVVDEGGELLLVSQFTVYGDARQGMRPGFSSAMPPAQAEGLYEKFVADMKARYPRVATGRFRSDMRVLVDNDGPITILLDSKRLF